MIGPDFHNDNTQQKPFDCRLETCIGKCDCEKIEQCKHSPEYYLRNPKVAEVMDVLDGPEQECVPLIDYVTNPAHGGKVTCHKCNGFIEDKDAVGYRDHQHKDDFPNTWFHKHCYDPEIDYWSHVMN